MDIAQILDLDDKVKAAGLIGEYYANINRSLVDDEDGNVMRVIDMINKIKKEFTDTESKELLDTVTGNWYRQNKTFLLAVGKIYDDMMIDNEYYWSTYIFTSNDLHDMVKKVIFKCYIRLLSNSDMLNIYKYLCQFKENPVVTDRDAITDIMKLCYNGKPCLSDGKELSVTDFNKITFEQFDCLYNLDEMCIEFYWDDTYLGDNYIFERFKPIEDPLIKHEMYKAYEKSINDKD